MPAAAAIDSISPTTCRRAIRSPRSFSWREACPHGLVDVIVAGHTHAGLAHQVDGIGIIQPYSRGQWFGRVDVIFDPAARRVARLQLFPPRQVCGRQDPATGNCASRDRIGCRGRVRRTARHTRSGDHSRDGAGARTRPCAPGGAVRFVCWRRPSLESTMAGRRSATSSPRRSATPCRARTLRRSTTQDACGRTSPAVRLTFGQLYNVFPFDNRLARVTLTGAELSRWLANEIGRRGTVGISGVDVHARCMPDGVHVDLFRGTERIDDNERLLGVTIGAPTLNGNLASPDFLGGVGPIENNPVAREVVEDWFRKLGRLTPSERERVLAPRPAVGCAAY